MSEARRHLFINGETEYPMIMVTMRKNSVFFVENLSYKCCFSSYFLWSQSRENESFTFRANAIVLIYLTETPRLRSASVLIVLEV